MQLFCKLWFEESSAHNIKNFMFPLNNDSVLHNKATNSTFSYLRPNLNLTISSRVTIPEINCKTKPLLFYPLQLDTATVPEGLKISAKYARMPRKNLI